MDSMEITEKFWQDHFDALAADAASTETLVLHAGETHIIHDADDLDAAVKAEAIRVADEALLHPDHGYVAEDYPYAVIVVRIVALRALAQKGRYTDPFGTIWTLTTA